MIHELELNDNLASLLAVFDFGDGQRDIKAVEHTVVSVQGAAGLYTQASPRPMSETCAQICSFAQRSGQHAPLAFSFEVYSVQLNPIIARPNHDPALPRHSGVRWMGLYY